MNYAKNKAKNLVDKFMNIEYLDDFYIRDSEAKQCAKITCEKIIEALDEIDCDENQNVMENINMEHRFYNEVIDEIEKL